MGTVAGTGVKRTLLLLAALWLLLPARALAALPPAVTEELPPQAQELLGTLDEDAPAQNLWQEGLHALRERGVAILEETLRQGVRGGAVLLAAVLLCALGETAFQSAAQTAVPSYVPLAGVLALTAAAADHLHGMMRMGEATIEELDVLAKTLLPTLAAATAASGGVVSAGVRQAATVFFANLLLSLIRSILLPLVYFYIAAAAADAALPGHRLKPIADGIRKGVTLTLTAALTLFTGYLTVSGAAAGSVDRVALQVTRSAISTAVPVVGGIISDAAGSVLTGAAALRSTVGIVGLLGVLAVCLAPFLTLGVQYLLYKVTAFLAGILGGGLTAYVDALGSAFGLILGMTASCGLLLLISVTSSIMVVMG